MDPFLSAFNKQFALVDRRSRELLRLTPFDKLFEQHGVGITRLSIGECLLRSAAMVEKTFGGITTRLWDDPFEWTLPEKLSDPQLIIQYLDEVEVTRQKGFGFIASDADLSKEIPAPEQLKTLAAILLETLSLASHHQGRAFGIFEVLTGDKLPKL